MTLEICCFGETDFNALGDGSEVKVIERSLVLEESGHVIRMTEFRSMVNKNSKRYRNKS